jgi:SulP family sulfate permease
MFYEWIPKSFVYLRQYRLDLFKKDLLAGITVGIVALPLAMAFAIASGVSPEKGIFTAIVAGFLISALGGSAVQIGGPTGAFVVIVYDILQRTGYEGLSLSTLIAGILLILFGVFRIGAWIKYVPYSLITGFTSAIAVIIFSSQIRDFFGLSIDELPASFLLQWALYFKMLPTMDVTTLAVGLSTLLCIYLFRRFLPRIPWGIAAIVIMTSLVALFQLPVQTIYSKFSSLPTRLPFPSLPSFFIPFDQLPEIIRDSFAIAFLGAIESLLSAVIADGMMGTRHKSNCELVGQGIANLGSVFFGGIPATGAIARTATNVKSGAQTPIAGMIHALVLLLILCFLSPLANKIPLASLSAILMVVAWNMSEAEHFLRLIRFPTSDTAILLAAFSMTLLVDITIAIMVGMVLASFLFMKKMSVHSKTIPFEATSEFPEQQDPDAIQRKHIPPSVEVYEMQGPFFFGSADILQNLIVNFTAPPKVFILRLHQVPFIDASGTQALVEFFQYCQKHQTVFLLSGVRGQIKKDLEAFGFIQKIGADHVFPHIDEALAKARLYTHVTHIGRL